MSKRATKQETELRVAHAAELVAEGQAYSSITSLVAAKYGISRRRAKQITSSVYPYTKRRYWKRGLKSSWNESKNKSVL